MAAKKPQPIAFERRYHIAESTWLDYADYTHPSHWVLVDLETAKNWVLDRIEWDKGDWDDGVAPSVYELMSDGTFRKVEVEISHNPTVNFK